MTYHVTFFIIYNEPIRCYYNKPTSLEMIVKIPHTEYRRLISQDETPRDLIDRKNNRPTLRYTYLMARGVVTISRVLGEQKLRSVIVSKSAVSGPVVSEEIIGKASGKFTAHSGSCGVTHLLLAYAILVRDIFC